MPIKQLEYPRFRADDGSGNPLSGGKVYTYAPGTTTNQTTWTDADKTAENTNPVILDADGEADIWFDANIKIKLDDSADVQQWVIDNIPPNANPAASGVFNLVLNGSFEESTTVATNWALTNFTDGTVTVDTTDQIHGRNSLKLTGAGSGGGIATSARFPVETGTGLMVSFTYKSSAADTLNVVQVKWYDSANSAISTDTLFSRGAGNPTSYTAFNVLAFSPANAVRAEIILRGVDSGGTNLSANTNFDNIVATEQCSLKQLGVASAVNYLEVTNSATGNDVVVTVNGTDTNADVDIQGKGSGVARLDGLAASQFLRSDADDTATGALTLSGRLTITNADDLDLVGVSGSIVIGGDGTGNHIAIDPNEIMAKSNGTTASTLLIHNQGGSVSFGNSIALTNFDVDYTNFNLNGVAMTATATELNLLDGCTSTTAELNILNGCTSTTAELNYNDITAAGAAQASKSLVLDANLDIDNINDITNVNSIGTTSINVVTTFQLGGTPVTSTATELNYNDITTLGTTQNSKTVTTDASGNINMPSGDGIALGGGSDYLNAYEEGSWTPAIWDDSESDSESQTYTLQQGRYTRIGNIVHVWGRISIISLGTLTGANSAKIGNLPIAAASSPTNSIYQVNFSSVSSINTVATASVTGSILNSASLISLELWDSALGTTNMTITEVSADADLSFSATYRV